jgi:peptidoglycan/xylan/chitin deacetylase (PgdA/CDA1 family)
MQSASPRRPVWSWLIAAAALVGCGDNAYRIAPYFDWDDATAIGAYNIDRLAGDDARMLSAVDSVVGSEAVVLFYGHDPPHQTTYEAIEGLLSRAEHDGLDVLTFADLAEPTATPRAGICLSFDDDQIADWFAMRELLARHSARVTFFVTRYAGFTTEQRAMLHALYADGHSIEAHSVHHLNANDYIAEHGLQAYVDDEVQPSIDVLRADGFHPVAYAHPFGAHSYELDQALVRRIRFARAISGKPK